MNGALLPHGGRVREAAARYGIAAADWLDLSTGISPRSVPLPAIPAQAWQRLPEAEDGLEAAARSYYQTEHLLPVAGSQAAIQALPQLRAPCNVAVLAPAYAEHAAAWQRAGHRVTPLPAEALLTAADTHEVLVLVNPCNPTAAVFSPEMLRAAHTRLATRGGWLVVDEAFIDATPALSLASESPRTGLVVLRSVGKFFGLAGARVGFVCAAPALLQVLAGRLGPWAVNGPARWVVQAALQDVAWQAGQRDWLARQSQRLAALLCAHSIRPSRSTAFFHYWRNAGAHALHTALCRHGILTRYFESPEALRIGLPADEAGFARLAAALAEIGR